MLQKLLTQEPEQSRSLFCLAPKDQSQTIQKGMTIVIPLAFLTGLIYFTFRYRPEEATNGLSWLWAVVPPIAFFLTTVWLYRLLRRPLYSWEGSPVAQRTSVSELAVLFVLGIAIVGCLVGAASKHAWDRLVTLKSIGDDQKTYRLWGADGSGHEETAVPIDRMHRHGDEAAHLAAAAAFKKAGLNISYLRELFQTGQEHDTRYWLRRPIIGHPPGLSMAFIPVSDNPQAARILNVLFLLACMIAIAWLGRVCSGNWAFALVLLAGFGTISDLLWWHSFAVSSDVLPCLPCFLGLAVLAQALRQSPPEDPSPPTDKIILLSLLFAVGSFITYTAFFPLVAICFFVLQWPQLRTIPRLTILAAPTTLVVVLTMLFSRYLVGDDASLVGERLKDLAGDESSYDDQGLTTLGFFRELPSRLGYPLFVVLAGTFIVALMTTPRSLWQRRGADFCAALVIAIPGIFMFYPQLRYLYPGWPLILNACGCFYVWPAMTTEHKAWCISTLGSFSIWKFILLRMVTP